MKRKCCRREKSDFPEEIFFSLRPFVSLRFRPSYVKNMDTDLLTTNQRIVHWSRTSPVFFSFHFFSFLLFSFFSSLLSATRWPCLHLIYSEHHRISPNSIRKFISRGTVRSLLRSNPSRERQERLWMVLCVVGLRQMKMSNCDDSLTDGAKDNDMLFLCLWHFSTLLSGTWKT